MDYTGKHVIIRSYSSGVFAGTVVSVCDSGVGRQRVVLNGSRRLWRSTGTASAVARSLTTCVIRGVCSL